MSPSVAALGLERQELQTSTSFIFGSLARRKCLPSQTRAKDLGGLGAKPPRKKKCWSLIPISKMKILWIMTLSADMCNWYSSTLPKGPTFSDPFGPAGSSYFFDIAFSVLNLLNSNFQWVTIWYLLCFYVSNHQKQNCVCTFYTYVDVCGHKIFVLSMTLQDSDWGSVTCI